MEILNTTLVLPGAQSVTYFSRHRLCGLLVKQTVDAGSLFLHFAYVAQWGKNSTAMSLSRYHDVKGELMFFYSFVFFFNDILLMH